MQRNTLQTERSTQAAASDGLPVPSRYWAMAAIALSIGMVVLDGALINVALPQIAHDLQITPAQAVWVAKIYLLAVAISLLPLSSLGDIYGYRPIYLGGLALFTLSAAACAAADSLPTLVVARFLQGLGGAGVMSVNVALVRFIYPHRLLGQGIGLNAMIVATATAVGPTVAAGVLAFASWSWLFGLHVPLGSIALLMSARTLPKTHRSPHRFDIVSAVLNGLGIALLIFAIDALSNRAPAAVVAAYFAAVVAVFYVLVRRQLSQPAPLLPVDLMRIPTFSLTAGTSMGAFTANMLAFIAVPFFLHDMLGRSAVETGLLMTPWPLATVVLAPIAGRLSDRYSAGVLCTLGMLLMCTGLVLMALLPKTPTDIDILWRMALCGVGFGLFHTPNNRTLIGSAPIHRTGGAAGVQGMARLMGQTMGAALAALIFGLMNDGTSVALFVAAGFAGTAAVVSSFRLIFKPKPR